MIQHGKTLLRIQLSVAGTGSTGNNLDSTSEERELETEIAGCTRIC
jgi:hypothetical protein